LLKSVIFVHHVGVVKTSDAQTSKSSAAFMSPWGGAMRVILAFLTFLFLHAAALAQQAAGADYVLTLDGVDHALALDSAVTIKLKSGQEVPVLLKKREFGRFATGDLSFEYPGAYSVASTPVDNDTTQHIVVTGLGTVMLVQHYEDRIPFGILNLMFEKMVEEPKALGLKIERTDLHRPIANGKIVDGVRAFYKGDDDEVSIDIITAKASNGGFLVLTLHDNNTAPNEKQMIERFWQSLSIQN
jgi:hypothetical protein